MTFTEAINRELQGISNWLKENKLSLNLGKSKFMVFRPQKNQKNKVLTFNIKIDDKKLTW